MTHMLGQASCPPRAQSPERSYLAGHHDTVRRKQEAVSGRHGDLRMNYNSPFCTGAVITRELICQRMTWLSVHCVPQSTDFWESDPASWGKIRKTIRAVRKLVADRSLICGWEGRCGFPLLMSRGARLGAHPTLERKQGIQPLVDTCAPAAIPSAESHTSHLSSNDLVITGEQPNTA